MQSERNQLLTKVAELEKKVNEKKVESHESFALAHIHKYLKKIMLINSSTALKVIILYFV